MLPCIYTCSRYGFGCRELKDKFSITIAKTGIESVKQHLIDVNLGENGHMLTWNESLSLFFDRTAMEIPSDSTAVREWKQYE